VEIKRRKLDGTYEITLLPVWDERGYFARTFDRHVFERAGLGRDWVEENQSLSRRRNTIRGLHVQLPPHSETKLVRCTRGAILDVFLDLRKGSSTFGRWDCIELAAETHNMVFIPRGFAHGFCTLTDECIVQYKTDNSYNALSECGILWNDPDLNIPWPTDRPVISSKDRSNLSVRQFIDTYDAI
jgi:dTDP-4-dehydrorhamnose 3,5-epimerase